MSGTRFVECGGDGFWAYDVGLGVLLKHLIDAAGQVSDEHPWLSEEVGRWRVIATGGEYSLRFSDWPPSRVVILQQLLDVAVARLKQQSVIAADEATSWDILNGEGVFFRGIAEFPASAVVLLAAALKDLLSGDLQPAPENHWWLYGVESGRKTIGKR